MNGARWREIADAMAFALLAGGLLAALQHFGCIE